MPSPAADPVWFSLPPLEADAATQMAWDAELLALCECNPDRAYLRFYRMTPPAVTIGRHQRWARVIDPAACAAHGWDWVRRPTGGGALLHQYEINYAVVAGRGAFPSAKPLGFRAIFGRILQGLAAGVAELGLRPDLPGRRSDRPTTGTARQHGLCGRALTHHELGLAGGKLVAAAQLLRPSAVLQHGTMYQQSPSPDERFWPLDPNGLDEHAWDQRWVALGTGCRLVPWSTVALLLQEGFLESLGVDCRAVEPEAAFLDRVGRQVAEWEDTGWHRRR